MSQSQRKMPLADAERIAQHMLKELASGIVMGEVAGSGKVSFSQ